MRRVRKAHLYLGLMFAPLLIFFAVTGAWQTFTLHERKGPNAPRPSRWLVVPSEVHKGQRLTARPEVGPSIPFRWFVLLMAGGLVITSMLGVYMAFKYSRNKLVLGLTLFSGVILPIVLLYL